MKFPDVVVKVHLGLLRFLSVLADRVCIDFCLSQSITHCTFYPLNIILISTDFEELGFALHEGSRPSKFEPNPHILLTRTPFHINKLGFHFDPAQFSSFRPCRILFLVHQNMDVNVKIQI